MKKLFLIIGAPGSGKTTDAERIASQNSGIAHYSTGDLLREEVSKGSDLGKVIDQYISKGNLVPLNIVVDTIVSALRNCPKDIVLIDGYPRSIEQMMALDDVLNKQDSIKLVCVIEVIVSREIAQDRVLGRARGSDDNYDVFNNRMNVYLQPLDGIERFYDSLNILERVNGERSIEDIVSDIECIINKKIKEQ